MALVFAETAPHPKGLARGERPLTTQLHHGTLRAVLLCGFCSAPSCGTPFAFWMEEQFGICLTTRTLVLPLPLVLRRCWQLSHRVHRAPLLLGRPRRRCLGPQWVQTP